MGSGECSKGPIIRDPIGHAEELGVYPKSKGGFRKGFQWWLKWGRPLISDLVRFQTFLLATCENGGWGVREEAAQEGVLESGGGEEGGEKGVV